MKHFSIGVLWRLAMLTLLLLTGINLAMSKQWLPASLLIILAGIMFYITYSYVVSVNRKLVRFFESVRYADFTVKFRSDNSLGESFQEINQQLNAVLDAFRQARAEKEANLHFINTIVQHVNVGLLSFDASGKIELINNAAFRTLGIYRLRNINELNNNTHNRLFEILKDLPSGGKALYETSKEQQITISSTTVSLRGRIIKLVSLQNIQSELQEKELDAWQNLTKVLRHEIMNSVTPIVSLASTMREIIEIDLSEKTEIKETVDDLKEALQTIENRSKGIMNFVNAYREFTTIPKPIFAETTAKTLVGQVLNLIQPQLKKKRIVLETDLKYDFSLVVDAEHIEMVLINLMKNAIEAVENKLNPEIRIRLYQADNQRFIEISDNGIGIEPDAIEKIFIPFFTTKKTGSGIGLSLSRQIMQMHGGNLKVVSKLGEGTKFLVIF
ncbi:integral membrane sensor signal transduction histidine kinase [Emticicia oligotrophica DSM 17448]|uniref:histidine kinase n=1 Tax=Emticicia oligotrophica (strain DSM 17448 / CIP 109782 / MTCC 6937 / GPTSA100-15) TaxID=929562 RepID=A0ABM5N101_EMTOG|nr:MULTISPECIES: ATP-binding protein [Emticicia]AFK03127.1 integral membrane sensor signal transduction histidine kinase [Emticicia oligotrophica DSM 17448]